MARPEPENGSTTGYFSSAPFRLIQKSFRVVFDLLRPVSPQLVPIVICLCVLPALIISSLLSGWVVWRNVPTGWQAPVYFNYGDGLSPHAELYLPKVVSNQRYDMYLHLTVPTTESNYALGNFMTTLTLSSLNNETIADIRRPTLILPPSTNLFSRRQRLIDLHIPLLFSFVPRTTQMMARIEVGRRDGWKSLGRGEGRELSVLSAFIRGNVRPKGIIGALSSFPITLAIMSSVTFFIISLLALIACLVPAVQWHFARVHPEEPNNVPTIMPRPNRSPDDPQFSRLSRRSSSITSQRLGSDAETISFQSINLPSPSPEPESSSIPFRRRLRRLADAASSDSD